MNDVRSIAWQQDGLITIGQCRALGISGARIKQRVRSRAWKVLTRGVYLVDTKIGDVDQPARRLIRAAQLAFGPHAVVVRESAAILHGIAGMGREPHRIHLSLPGNNALPHRLGDAVVVPHQLTIAGEDIVELDGIRVTNPVRTVADVLLFARRLDSVSALDSALNTGQVVQSDLPKILGLMAGRRGVVAARERLALADGRAESPLETRVRLRCVDGGVAPDDLQVPLLDGLVRVDMLWRRARVVGEADGEGIHGMPGPLFRDRKRQNALAAAEYRVIRFTWQDTLTPGRIPAIVRRALAGGREFGQS